MARRSKLVRQHIQQARDAALSAVDGYNRIGNSFRTRNFVILMMIAWTSCFHAVFYNQKIKPWYVKNGSGKNICYELVDGQPKHWDLSECMNRYWDGQHPAERENLEFFVGLRNKIEHRYYPELDPALYGECQAMLMNFEDMLINEFGTDMALLDKVGLALQFSVLRSSEQEKAIRRLQKTSLNDIRHYVETFRAGLAPEILDSSQFALRVFLIPKLENNSKKADLPVEFVHYDANSPVEMEDLRNITALIKEKKIPVVSKGLLKPQAVVERLKQRLKYKFTQHTHTCCWKYYQARPLGNSDQPEKTISEFCLYDELSKSYGYTEAWVNFLYKKLSDPAEYQAVTGKKPDQLSA